MEDKQTSVVYGRCLLGLVSLERQAIRQATGDAKQHTHSCFIICIQVQMYLLYIPNSLEHKIDVVHTITYLHYNDHPPSQSCH